MCLSAVPYSMACVECPFRKSDHLKGGGVIKVVANTTKNNESLITPKPRPTSVSS